MELKAKFHLQIDKNEHPGWRYAEEEIVSWMNCIHSNTSSELLQAQAIANVNFVLQKLSNPALRKLVRNQSGLLIIHRTSLKETYL